MTSLIAALVLAPPVQAPTNAVLAVGLRTVGGEYQTFAGSKLGVSSFLRRMPGQLWIPEEDGWREVGLVVKQAKPALFGGADGELKHLIQLNPYPTNLGKAYFASVTREQASFEFEDPNGLPSTTVDRGYGEMLTVRWPESTYTRPEWDAGLTEAQKELVSRDISQQIESTRGHQIRPDGWDVIDWARIHSQGRWQLMLRVTGVQRSASGVLKLLTDDHLSELERKEADSLMSSARSQHSDAIDAHADDKTGLAVILTPSRLHLHEYRRGSLGRELKSTMVRGLQIVMAEGDASSRAREIAQQAGSVKPTAIPDGEDY